MLAGTRWNWGDAVLELKADGSTYQPTWDDRSPDHPVGGARPSDRPARRREGAEAEPVLGPRVRRGPERVHRVRYGPGDRMPPKRRVGPLAQTGFAPRPARRPGDPGRSCDRRRAGFRVGAGRRPAEVERGRVGGVPARPGPGSRRAARWEPVDRRTAVALIPQGKADDRLAVLQFSDDVQELTGYDFENAARLPARKRLDPAPARRRRAAEHGRPRARRPAGRAGLPIRPPK